MKKIWDEQPQGVVPDEVLGFAGEPLCSEQLERSPKRCRGEVPQSSSVAPAVADSAGMSPKEPQKRVSSEFLAELRQRTCQAKKTADESMLLYKRLAAELRLAEASASLDEEAEEEDTAVEKPTADEVAFLKASPLDAWVTACLVESVPKLYGRGSDEVREAECLVKDNADVARLRSSVLWNVAQRPIPRLCIKQRERSVHAEDVMAEQRWC